MRIVDKALIRNPFSDAELKSVIDEDYMVSLPLHSPERYRIGYIHRKAYQAGKNDAKNGTIKNTAPKSLKGENWPIGKLSEAEQEFYLSIYATGVEHALGYKPQRRGRGRPKGSGKPVMLGPKRPRGRPRKLTNPVLKPGQAVDIISGPYKGPGEIIAYVPFDKYRVFLLKINDERLIPANNIARTNPGEDMSTIRMNPRTKGAKDTYPRTRLTNIQLRKLGRSDKLEGLPPMSHSEAYMYGYTGGRSKPRKQSKKVERRGRPKGSLNKKTIRRVQDEQDFYRYNPKRKSNSFTLGLYDSRGKHITTLKGSGSEAQATKEAKAIIGQKCMGHTVHKAVLNSGK